MLQLQQAYIVIYGRPATKKNSSRVFKVGKFTRVLPSKAFEDYERAALTQLLKYRERFDGSIAVCCKYWLPDKRWWPDLVGLLQATSDILEKAQIIKNDSDIVNYDGSRIMGLDKKNPRVEITISRVDKWEWEKEV